MDDYDEFGNFIGVLSDSDSASEPGEQAVQHLIIPDDMEESQLQMVDDVVPMTSIVLHEDKKYYSNLQETYGPDVETIVQEQDTQTLAEPIVKPVEKRRFQVTSKGLPKTRFDKQFLLDLGKYPEFMRNIALVGHLHSGKTSLMDVFVYETHKLAVDVYKQERYSDVHGLSRSRKISIKSSPMSFVLQTSRGKSHRFNVIDTPGHVNFLDESVACLELVDGAVLVLDSLEGVMAADELLIAHMMQREIPFTLVVNKIDRLILELKLPPEEAYYKLRHTIEAVNAVISKYSSDPVYRLSPEQNNVLFASTEMGWMFSVYSFSRMYAEWPDQAIPDPEQLGKRLWGDIYYEEQSRRFTRDAKGNKRSFVYFILEPLWKLYAQVIGEDAGGESMSRALDSLGITLTTEQHKWDARPLLKIVLAQFFGHHPCQSFADMIAEHVSAPNQPQRIAKKLRQSYTGTMESILIESMLKSDSDGPLVIHATKLYQTPDAKDFRTFGRIMSGIVTKGMAVRVLGSNYSADDDEDMAVARVEKVLISEARYMLETESAGPGELVMLQGVSDSSTKSATIVNATHDLLTEDVDLAIFRPVQHIIQPVLKVAIEPVAPSELPKMLEGLRKVQKSYHALQTRVEESGEHVLFGTGELYLDCVMHDLRRLYSGIEIKISDPATRFCETIIDTSILQCYANSSNQKNKITCTAEPLDKGLAEEIEGNKISIKMPGLKDHLKVQHSWDTLAVKSLWGFGPDEAPGNALLDDSIPDQTDKKTLGIVKEFVKQGFEWATKEGPLCGEPIRNVKFKIIDAALASEPVYRGGGQIIPAMRRVCYSSFLMATPRLMEPVYAVEIQAPAEQVNIVYDILAKRRGHVIKDTPTPGSILSILKALVPVMDANGLESDLRVASGGKAFCQQYFDHWAIVPGDPLDADVVLRPLEPAPPTVLARDFVSKTRKRKGLNAAVGKNLLAQYLEPEAQVALASSAYRHLLM